MSGKNTKNEARELRPATALHLRQDHSPHLRIRGSPHPPRVMVNILAGKYTGV